MPGFHPRPAPIRHSPDQPQCRPQQERTGGELDQVSVFEPVPAAVSAGFR